MIRRLIFASTLLVALSGCGSDDTKSSTRDDASTKPTKVVFVIPATDAEDAAAVEETPATTDPGTAAKPVYQCSSFSVDGTVGSTHIGGFDDVTARGVSCDEVINMVTAKFDASSAPKLNDINGYTCSVLYKEGDAVTGRCENADGQAFRATTVPATTRSSTNTGNTETKVTADNIVSRCPSSSLFYDITVRGVTCAAGTQAIGLNADKFRTTSNLTLDVDGTTLTCSELYAEGNHKTVRCVDATGTVAIRFTIGTKPVTAASGVPTTIVTSCPAYSQYFGITVRGVTCQYAVSVMNDGGDIFVALDRGQTTSPPRSGFTCTRIDTGKEERTIRCAKGDTAFRFSMVGDG